MKPLVELISEWDAYESSHKGATVEEFCRYYLVTRKEKEEDKLFEGMRPPDLDTVAAKLIGRLAAMHMAYAKLALKEKAMDGVEVEWFYFLNAIYHQREARKTDIIQYNFYEPSTGNDILRRIKLAGLITEREDPHDKRARLVKLTTAGETLLLQLYELLYKSNYLMFSELSDVDKKLIVRLLGDTEVKHGKILAESRNKSIDEILEQAGMMEKFREVMKQTKSRVQQFRKKR